MLHKRAILEVSSEGIGGGAKHVYDLVRSLQDDYTFIVACPDNGPYLGKFKELGVAVCELPATMFSPGSFLQLRRAVQAYGVDLVHVHGRKAGFYGRVVGLVAKKPLIYSFHGLHYKKHGFFLRTLYLWIERTLNRHTAKVISVSTSEHQESLATGLVDDRRSLVIYNGIDSKSFDTIDVDVHRKKAELGFQPHDLIVGNIATFDVQKGHDQLVSAIPMVIRCHPRTKFLFIGDGKLRPQIQRQVASLGVERHTVFVGFRHDVPALLQAMDIVVLPSRWEGLPMVLLEAMAACKPIVATAVTGNVDVIVDGVCGFLVPFGKPHILAEKIMLLVQDAQLRMEFGRQGRLRVEHHFSLETMVKRTRAVYEEVLQSP